MGNPTLTLNRAHPGDWFTLVEGTRRTWVEVKSIDRAALDEEEQPCTTVVLKVKKKTKVHKRASEIILYVPDDAVAANALLWVLSPFDAVEYFNS